MSTASRAIDPATSGDKAGMRIARLAFLAVVLTGVSCRDPALDDRIDNLGKETSGIPKNEFHRAGQPCTACHVEGGPASDSPFSVAGTVFAQPARLVGVSGVEIRMVDAEGSKHIAKTNCVGNFFVTPDGADGWSPKFPILVEIEKSNLRKRMTTVIGRASSCGDCHVSTVDVGDPLSQVPHIYLFGGDEPGKPNGDTDCAVDPRAPGDPAPGTEAPPPPAPAGDGGP
jgi:hypothetical protein